MRASARGAALKWCAVLLEGSVRSLVWRSSQVAILIFGVFLRGYEVANGHPFLRSPKAEDGLLVIVGLVLVVFLPYLVGINAARLFWRSRVRFYRNYQHQ